MTHDGNEAGAATRPGTSLFVSGIVLGIALGSAVSHVLLFAGGGSSDAATSAEAEFAQLVASSPRFAALDAPVLPDEVSDTILEFDGEEDVGRVTISDQRSDDDYLHFFPEAMQSPDTGATSLAAAGAEGTSTSSGPLQMTADESRADEAPPQALQPSPAAAPIDKATSDRQALAQKIIRDELPRATAQEREIWYDVLQGLPAEDIKGILRMRKHIGPRDNSALSTLLSITPPMESVDPAAPQVPPVPVPAATRTPVAERLDQIAAHNRANRETIAFKRLVPVLVEANLDADADVQICRVVRDMSQGELQSTGRTLDVAISGPGFLQVRQDDEVRYTRDGRLTLDDDGNLCLLAAIGLWHLDPLLSVPEEAIDIRISTTGEVEAILADTTTASLGRIPVVQFLNPQALQSDSAGLFRPVSATGTAQAERTPLTGQLMQGQLERSNSPRQSRDGTPLD